LACIERKPKGIFKFTGIERIAKSKFNIYPDFGLAKEGHIGLQDHGQQVWYRNIRIL